MSDEKVRTAADVAYDVFQNAYRAEAIVEADRRAIASSARAEGEAAGHQRAVEDCAKHLEGMSAGGGYLGPEDERRTRSLYQLMADAIRAKFGGK